MAKVPEELENVTLKVLSEVGDSWYSLEGLSLEYAIAKLRAEAFETLQDWYHEPGEFSVKIILEINRNET